MRKMALVLAVPAALAYGQSNPPAPSQPGAAQPAAPAEKTVEQTASPELVGNLVKELGITPTQAQGAAGTMFGVAKSKLSADDFAKIATAVPNMDGLLKAAGPAAGGKTSAIDLVSGAAGAAGLGGAANAAAAASALSKLGLKTETIAKLPPTLVKLIESKGGAEVGALLAGALK